MKNFKYALYSPMQDEPWYKERNLNLFSKYIEWWQDENNLDGRAASLIFHRRHHGRENRLTYMEVLSLILSGAVDPDFYSISEDGEEIELLEHYAHSIVELYAHIQMALDRHREQLKQIKGTPNGRIRAPEKLEPR